tara:strand:+ start:3652 stop:3999 length:348 start_codon:yes stop_codon:yes gene_type:complete
MKKRFLILLAILSFGTSQAQEIEELNEVPQELVGIWKSFENEFLRIGLRGNFQRVDGVTKKVVSSGTIVVEGNRIKVYRQDIDDEYTLGYFINEQTFVVGRPRNPNRAWLFYKVN